MNAVKGAIESSKISLEASAAKTLEGAMPKASKEVIDAAAKALAQLYAEGKAEIEEIVQGARAAAKAAPGGTWAKKLNAINNPEAVRLLEGSLKTAAKGSRGALANAAGRFVPGLNIEG